MYSKTNITALIVTLFGAAKIALNAFGIDLFSDAQINDIANGVAALVSVAGPIVMHVLHKKAVKAVAPVAPAPTVPTTQK